MGIVFCPWCGELLPGSVRVRYFDTLNEDLGMEDYDVFSPDDGLPEEMLTDTWWRRREIGPTADLNKIGEVARLREGALYEYDGPYANELPGYAVPSEAPPHLCRSLLQTVRRDDDMFTYIPETREFGIRMIDPSRPVDNQPIRVRAVRFCPWCGVELPTSLRSEWLTHVEAAGHSPDDPDLPAPMKCGVWWRSLGF